MNKAINNILAYQRGKPWVRFLSAAANCDKEIIITVDGLFIHNFMDIVVIQDNNILTIKNTKYHETINASLYGYIAGSIICLLATIMILYDVAMNINPSRFDGAFTTSVPLPMKALVTFMLALAAALGYIYIKWLASVAVRVLEEALEQQ